MGTYKEIADVHGESDIIKALMNVFDKSGCDPDICARAALMGAMSILAKANGMLGDMAKMTSMAGMMQGLATGDLEMVKAIDGTKDAKEFMAAWEFFVAPYMLRLTAIAKALGIDLPPPPPPEKGTVQ